MASAMRLGILLLLSALLPASAAAVPFNCKESGSELNITFGEVVVVLSKSPWRMRVLDSSTGKEVVTESSDQSHRMGFGKWEGEYLDIYEGYLFRVGLIVEWHPATDIVTWTTTSDSVIVSVNTDDQRKRSLRVNFTAFQERQFSMHVQVEGTGAEESNRMAVGYMTPEDEKFYGFGERFTDCNQRGHRVGSWLEDGSWGAGVFDPDKWKLRIPKGEESTYCPMPLLLSSRRYAMQMDTSYRTVYDLAKETTGIMKLEQETNALDITFYVSRTPREAFSMTVEKNGRSLIPPPWDFSPWNQMGSEVDGESDIQRTIDFFFKYDIPCSHNVHTTHFFPDGEQRGHEAQLKAENEQLLSLGIKTTAYFNPMITTTYSELYNTAAANGYFLKTQDGRPYNFTYIAAANFHVSQLDFSNPAAVKWYQQQLQEAVDLKYNGWMYDYGEYTPHDSVAMNGDSGLKMHNEFALLYQKAAFDFLTSLDPNPSDEYAPDYVFYVRSSYTGSQRYTWSHWTGDPSSDWSFASGLPAQLKASINIGLSGMPFSGSDIGGFEWYVDPVPDLELWSRWTAAGCVSGLMHEQGGGKGTGKKSHIFDFPNGTAIWRKFAKLRTQLFPYIYTEAHTAHKTGLPLMQHHILNFWNDSKAMGQCLQYMFGSSFLAAPVVDEGKTQWSVYLPSHGPDLGPRWLDVGSTFKYEEFDGRFRIGFSGYHSGGETVTVNVPLDSLPLFVLAGSIIPILDPRVQTLNNATNTSVITWLKLKDIRHAWVFADLDFSASGKTWDGLEYQLRRTADKQLLFSVTGAPQGATHIPQIAGPWEVEGFPVNVTSSEPLKEYSSWQDLLNGETGGYSYDKEQRTLWLKLVSSSKATIFLR